jgi:hypothetical protein
VHLVKLAFCTMTSRSARLLLSEQEKSAMLNRVTRFLSRLDARTTPLAMAYRELRLVLEPREQVLKIMTEHEFRRLHPLLTAISIVQERQTRAA